MGLERGMFLPGQIVLDFSELDSCPSARGAMGQEDCVSAQTIQSKGELRS